MTETEIQSLHRRLDSFERMIIKNRDIPNDITMSELVVDLKRHLDQKTEEQSTRFSEELKKLRTDVQPVIDAFTKTQRSV